MKAQTIKRFYRNRQYIGVRNHECDSFGEWKPILSAHVFTGRPPSVYVFDEVYEYSETQWAEIIERIKRQSTELKREVKFNSKFATSYPIWIHKPIAKEQPL